MRRRAARNNDNLLQLAYILAFVIYVLRMIQRYAEVLGTV